ncbi:hypothetical protein QEG73_04920 [Chitinophagaceae bacterium 26-R-25]|nr:hypothetical protein [Chitinophagaceae bacterium 26-R-25]
MAGTAGKLACLVVKADAKFLIKEKDDSTALCEKISIGRKRFAAN